MGDHTEECARLRRALRRQARIALREMGLNDEQDGLGDTVRMDKRCAHADYLEGRERVDAAARGVQTLRGFEAGAVPGRRWTDAPRRGKPGN